MTWAIEFTHTTPAIFALMIFAAFGAGIIRGFAGFALSAFFMAILTSFVPPIQLIPMMWFMEMSASLLLMRGGWKDADRRMALTLCTTAGIGLPVGLLLTLALPEGASKVLALGILVTLATLQLLRIRIPFLATTPGLYTAGFGGGMATGLAGLGGMFIAVYVLSQEVPARKMRGTMNIYMLGAPALGLIAHLSLGTMDQTAAQRGLFFMFFSLAGVFVGQALFTPKYERYYKPVCLTLLIGLAFVGLLRLSLQG